jgi:hypothetical protein
VQGVGVPELLDPYPVRGDLQALSQAARAARARKEEAVMAKRYRAPTKAQLANLRAAATGTTPMAGGYVSRPALEALLDAYDRARLPRAAERWRTGVPKTTGVYLVSTRSGDVREAYCDALSGKWSTDDFGDMEIEPVLAWMPLPKPFKPAKVKP